MHPNHDEAWARRVLDDDARRRIEAAVAAAEGRTRGELVPMLVRSSTTTGHVAPLILLLLWTLVLAVSDAVGGLPWLVVIALVVAAFPAALGLARLPLARRLLTSRADRERQVFARAHLEFLAAGLDRTRESTGVLLFASWEERQIVVLADRGIADHLPPEAWEGVRDDLRAGLARGDAAGGFEAAIARCAGLLAPRFPPREDDPNELADAPVVSP